MNTLLKKVSILGSALVIALSATSLQAKRQKMPDTTADGLLLIKKAKGADYVYALEEADLSIYNRIILLEPNIAFRKHWQDDINSGRTIDRISDSDMEAMIAGGKEIFMKQFTKTLDKKKYPIAEKPEGDVLLVKATIANLEINAPDPDRTNGTWTKIYTEEAGEATLIIELYDSVTGQILIRAIDHQEIGEQFGMPIARTQFTNINDARDVFDMWAKALARGLDNAKKAKSKE